MESYELNLCGLKRKLPLIPINEDMAYASFVILGEVELVSRSAAELSKNIEGIDYIVTAEAKGIPLAYEISKLLGLPGYIVIRKSVKTYMKEPLCEVVRSITTKGSQHLYLDEEDAEKIKGKTICIVDDVISTGESLRAIEKLMARAGANTKYKIAILAEGDAAKREDILFLDKLPLFQKNGEGEYEPIGISK